MKTNTTAILLIIFCTFLNSFAQVFYKMGAKNLSLLRFDISYFFIILGVLTYGVSFLFFITALKKGELSTLYPFIATGFIWVLFLSNYFFDEMISITKISGVLFIVLGISLIGIGGAK